MSHTRGRFRREIAVIGLGLIGGSLGLALRRRGWSVVGVDRSRAALKRARSRGAISRAARGVADGVRNAGIVVLSAPVPEIVAMAGNVAAAARSDAVITDTGSVKRPIVEVMARLLPRPGRFVGAHPMTGSERSGIDAANASLFRGRRCVLTPTAATEPKARALVSGVWRSCGARVLSMSPRRHDRLASRVSHLPHVLAVALMRSALKDGSAAALAAGSFLDATRVAASPPELWQGIFSANRAEVAAAVAEFSRELGRLSRRLRAGDGLLGPLRSASARRRSLTGAATPPGRRG